RRTSAATSSTNVMNAAAKTTESTSACWTRTRRNGLPRSFLSIFHPLKKACTRAGEPRFSPPTINFQPSEYARETTSVHETHDARSGSAPSISHETFHRADTGVSRTASLHLVIDGVQPSCCERIAAAIDARPLT